MYRSTEAFLKYFDAVNRRAVRDIAELPPEADGWKPATENTSTWKIEDGAFVARMQLDAATRNGYALIHVDYDRALERTYARATLSD